MSGRQHTMALFFAAILFAVVVATAAKTQSPGVATSQVDVSIRPPAPETLLADRSNMTSRAETPLQPTRPFPSHEIASLTGTSLRAKKRYLPPAGDVRHPWPLSIMDSICAVLKLACLFQGFKHVLQSDRQVVSYS
jgi:hypothetical protein